jgi:hypothetical protein
MVVADLEHANTRVATVERRNVHDLIYIPYLSLTPAHRNFFVQRSRPSGVEALLPTGSSWLL